MVALSIFIFKLFSKGDQLKVKLANLKFSKIGDGPSFLLFGGFSNRGKGLFDMHGAVAQVQFGQG